MLKVSKELRVLMVHREKQALKEHKVIKELRALTVLKESKDLRENKVNRVR